MSASYVFKKQPNIFDEVEKFLQKRGPAKGIPLELRSTPRRFFGVPSQYVFSTRMPLFEYWDEIMTKIRDIPQTEFIDEITEMRREIDILRYRAKSVEQELASCKQTIDEMSKVVYEGLTIKQTKLATIADLCKAYVDLVSTINIVRQVLIVTTNHIATIWTIIDAPPFQDSLRTPIYDAQVKILSTLKENIPLDFYVLNVAELSEDEKLEDIIPSNAKLVWER